MSFYKRLDLCSAPICLDCIVRIRNWPQLIILCNIGNRKIIKTMMFHKMESKQANFEADTCDRNFW